MNSANLPTPLPNLQECPSYSSGVCTFLIVNRPLPTRQEQASSYSSIGPFPPGYSSIGPFLLRSRHLPWVMTALCKRRCMLKHGTWRSNWIDISIGLPQGSFLSPVLFNIYTLPLARINHADCRLSAFADDINLLCDRQITTATCPENSAHASRHQDLLR